MSGVSLPAKKVEASASRTSFFKKGLCIGVIFAIALFLLTILPAWRSDEPRYQGKRLSDWMEEQTGMPQSTSVPRARRELQRQLETLTNIVRSIGTNGLPCYLDWIENAPDGDSWY